MNERFYFLSEEKRNSIINAAYKVFARNDYKKAPMSEIASEGNISKALLFHYFENKIGLYMFLWEHALKLSSSAAENCRVYETGDFFEMLRRSLSGKCALMRKYPYLTLFCMKAYYEKEVEVQKRIRKSFSDANSLAFGRVSEHTDVSNLRPGISIKDVYREVIYASDGFLLEQFRAGNPDADYMEREYERMIAFWKKSFGKENGG